MFISNSDKFKGKELDCVDCSLNGLSGALLACVPHDFENVGSTADCDDRTSRFIEDNKFNGMLDDRISEALDCNTFIDLTRSLSRELATRLCEILFVEDVADDNSESEISSSSYFSSCKESPSLNVDSFTF